MFNRSKVTLHGIRSEAMSNVISAMQAQSFLIKDCEAFLALVLDSKNGTSEFRKDSYGQGIP